PPDNIEYAFGQSGFMKQAGQRDNGAGSVLGALENNGAPGPDGRTNFTDGLVVRKIPRCKGGAHANGLTQDHLPDLRLAGRNDAPVNVAALFSMPVGVVSAGFDLTNGFGQWLALVQRHVAANLFGLLA